MNNDSKIQFKKIISSQSKKQIEEKVERRPDIIVAMRHPEKVGCQPDGIASARHREKVGCRLDKDGGCETSGESGISAG